MDVVISEKQEEKIKSTIIEIVEDIEVPLAIKVDVVIEKGKIFVLVLLKNYLMTKVKTKYQLLIHNKIKNYLGLDVSAILLEEWTIDS